MNTIPTGPFGSTGHASTRVIFGAAVLGNLTESEAARTLELVLERGNVAFRWVKGHGTDPMNELVDLLAVEASLKQVSASGTLGD